jgi:transitional endoplasmic reticulum ATPase
MDGLEELHNVIVIAATNRPDMLDPALLRPGRFDKLLLVQIPDEKAREEIFKVHTKGMPISPTLDIKSLVKMTDGFVGADIEALCREAAMIAIREVLRKGEEISEKEITLDHFMQAMKKIRPSVDKRVEESYENFLKRYEARELEKLSYMA